ncbi:T-complex protein 11-like protein 2 [Anarrhichthys ocellatus]|uniref:T-complex protein 11-like protein 2 n=1 Tax=Anarrhichthys ocellatus TaxID=433405 RepID=UPI0012ED4DB6|nr:T-complex protein 11-like protein 2 [Anarrhichthys ocellatus]XP_031714795.1 T-complex protein 11-like protein 2 [Anarrhichthys ocellatus]
MPLNDERPGSTSSGEERGSDVESSSERCDSMMSTSDLDCSRESFTSDCSSKHCTPSSSPPKTIKLDEVMESTRDLSNLSIAHEIIVNRNFHLEPDRLPQDSLWKIVRDYVHKAFWDILESELNDDPPEYGQAIRLLEEIREVLLSFLNPGTNRMRTQITEVLNMDLIRQQADNDAVDIQGLASYIITTMGKLCAPVRDEDIQKLRESPDNTVSLFREIFHVLDLMKADVVNFTIDNLRPVLHRQGVEYERATFQSILDKTPSALEHTTSWIKSALEELSTPITKEQTDGQGKGKRLVPGPFQVLNVAFLRILTWDYDKSPLPETWMTDETRLREIQWQLQQCEAVNEVLLIIYSTIGGAIQGLPSLSDRLKRMISVLLDGMHSKDFNLEEALRSVSAQICCELNKSLTERSYPSLSPALQATLTGQICSITQKDNPIRTLVEDRVQRFFTVLIWDPKPKIKLEQVPAGLTAIKPELALMGAQFISLVNYNKSVYGPFYADIIRKLMFSSSPPAANPPQDTALDSVTSN